MTIRAILVAIETSETDSARIAPNPTAKMARVRKAVPLLRIPASLLACFTVEL